jgi:3-oxoadipate enol-lactonase
MLVQLENIRLNAIDEGEGPVLLILHGLGATHRNWEEQIDAFREDFRVVAPDLRGAGLSDCPPGPYTLEDMADDVAELCDRLGVEHAFVAAQSMGGMVAQALAVRRPELVDGLILVATTSQNLLGDQPPSTLGPLEQSVLDHGLGVLPDMVRDAVFPPSFQAAHADKVLHFERELVSFDPDALIAAMRRTNEIDFTAELAELTVPALVVAGAHDQVFPMGEVEHLVGLLPDVQLVVMPDCGHQPHYEDPQGFNALMRDFIAAHS